MTTCMQSIWPVPWALCQRFKKKFYGAQGGSYKPAVIRTTLLVVGEGPDDQAFIKHIKGLFYKRDCGKSVKVEAEDGGSPGNIISNAIRKFRSFAYDQRFWYWMQIFRPLRMNGKKQN